MDAVLCIATGYIIGFRNWVQFWVEQQGTLLGRATWYIIGYCNWVYYRVGQLSILMYVATGCFIV
jgi:hypothetical protein